MINFNIKELKSNAQIQKNTLYRISTDRTVQVCEEHADCGDKEIVNLEYSLEEGQYALFGNEYRNPLVSSKGCKTTDVLTCLIDDEYSKIYTLILDVKRNISAFSDDLFKDNALLVAIKEVSEFVEQLCHAKLHKDSFLLYLKAAGYSEVLEVGIATKVFEREKFLDVAEFLEGLKDLEKPANMQPLVWLKFKNNLAPYVCEAGKLRNFADRLVEIEGETYPLKLYLLKPEKKNEYTVSIHLKLDRMLEKAI